MTPTPPLPKLPEPAMKESKGVCCGNFTTGAEYMGQSEELCCGQLDEAWPDYYTADQIHTLIAERDAEWLEALSQRGEAAATVVRMRRHADGVVKATIAPHEGFDLEANVHAQLFTAPQPAQSDVLSLLLSDEVLEAATLAHEQSSCHDLIGPMSDALKAAAERVRAMVPAQPSAVAQAIRARLAEESCRVPNRSDKQGDDFASGLRSGLRVALEIADAAQPTLINGLTQAETDASASVAGLAAQPSEAHDVRRILLRIVPGRSSCEHCRQSCLR